MNSFIMIALDLLVKAIEKGGYTGRIKIGIDAAASEFYNDRENKYDLNNKEEGKPNWVCYCEIFIFFVLEFYRIDDKRRTDQLLCSII